MKRKWLFAFFAALILGGGLWFFFGSLPAPEDESPKPRPVESGKKSAEPKSPQSVRLSPKTKRPAERPPTPSIAGHVYRSDGKPAWRALVRCLLGPYYEVKRTFTDRKGFFRFTDLDKETVYSIEASARRHAPVRFDNVEVGTENLVFKLKRGGRLEGFVCSEDVGMPLSSFTVHLKGPETKEVPVENSDGVFRLDGLKGGVYTVWISAEGYGDSSPMRISIEEGKETKENFLLPPEGR